MSIQGPGGQQDPVNAYLQSLASNPSVQSNSVLEHVVQAVESLYDQITQGTSSNSATYNSASVGGGGSSGAASGSSPSAADIEDAIAQELLSLLDDALGEGESAGSGNVVSGAGNTINGANNSVGGFDNTTNGNGNLDFGIGNSQSGSNNATIGFVIPKAVPVISITASATCNPAAINSSKAT